MDINEKILFAKRQIAKAWKCDASVFDFETNVFLETTDTFFSIVTSGNNAVIRGDKEIIGWCSDKFNATLARDIMDGERRVALAGADDYLDSLWQIGIDTALNTDIAVLERI